MCRSHGLLVVPGSSRRLDGACSTRQTLPHNGFALRHGSYPTCALVASLCAGDESTFAQLVDRYTPTMLRVARGYVRSHETAEEVVQETWIALIKGISKFEG